MKWIVVLSAVAVSATARGAERVGLPAGDTSVGLDSNAAAMHAAITDAGGAGTAALTPSALADLAEEGGGAGSSSIILSDALLGLIAGAVVGAGVALIEGGNWGRDIAIGAGVGLVLGGLVGGVSSLSDVGPGRLASDGMGTPRRDPVIDARGIGVGARF